VTGRNVVPDREKTQGRHRTAKRAVGHFTAHATRPIFNRFAVHRRTELLAKLLAEKDSAGIP
jgi:hypothetical protein